MKPIYVRITTSPRALKVGDDLRLDCETSGSRPPAKIVWWLENKILPNSGKQTFYTNRNITYSSIHLSPSVEDNGKLVSCKAENPALPNSDMHDTWTLNIHCKLIIFYVHLFLHMKFCNLMKVVIILEKL